MNCNYRLPFDLSKDTKSLAEDIIKKINISAKETNRLATAKLVPLPGPDIVPQHLYLSYSTPISSPVSNQILTTHSPKRICRKRRKRKRFSKSCPKTQKIIVNYVLKMISNTFLT